LCRAGAYSAGLINEEQRFDIVRNSCPGAGACGGMYTANTMASAIEVRHRPYTPHVPTMPFSLGSPLYLPPVIRCLPADGRRYNCPHQAMGMTLPYSSSIPAEDPLKRDECRMAGAALLNMMKLDLKPRDIMVSPPPP
jgi:dihydroxy-acid dehydratase